MFQQNITNHKKVNSVLEGIIHFIEEQFDIPLPLVFALTAGLFSLIGVTLAVANRKAAENLSKIAALVGGVLLCLITAFHLLPEAFLFGSSAGIYICLGLLTGWLLDKTGHSKDKNIKKATITPILAIGLHSLLDGLVYVVSLEHSHEGGLFAGSGLILHELPEGLLTFVLCLGFFKSYTRAIIVAIITAAISTPVGACLGLILDHQLGETFLHYAFPISAGLVGWAGVNLLYRAGTEIFLKQKGDAKV